MSRIRACSALVSLAIGLALPSATRADLPAYLATDDGAFRWEVTETREADEGRVTHMRLVSQRWQDEPWTHAVRIYEPKRVEHREFALLFITGGGTDSRPKPEDDALGFQLATLCRGRVVVLPQVPNQPLLGGKHEDALIAETFVRYLDNGDETLPLLFPMVKSAVKAMDAAQQWALTTDRPPILKFVVTGASKRGWTTWLTGASDSRVAAIAPMVIPTLNMRAQNKHQVEVWGKYSEQIEDYTRRGLIEAVETPKGEKLWRMIDPYSYRDKLAMPKLQINGTNDRYWTLDSLNLYWNQLVGPSHVVYLPNAGHGLEKNREYATHGIAAIYRLTARGATLPPFSWSFADGESDVILKVDAPGSESVQLQVAEAAERDFRESRWEPRDATEDDVVTFRRDRPSIGRSAIFADATYRLDDLEYHLSTQIREFGPRK